MGHVETEKGEIVIHAPTNSEAASLSFFTSEAASLYSKHLENSRLQTKLLEKSVSLILQPRYVRSQCHNGMIKQYVYKYPKYFGGL